MLWLIITLIGPIIFLISGLFCYFRPPKKINYFYGFRTKTTMSSQKAWDKAQRYMSIVMLISAVVGIIVAIVWNIIMYHNDGNIWILVMIPVAAWFTTFVVGIIISHEKVKKFIKQ